MKTDAEIFDSLGVPEDRREQLADWLHAFAKASLPGPNLYAIWAAIFWNVLKDQTPWQLPEDAFDPSVWIEEYYDPEHDGALGTVRGWPWVGLDV